MGLSLVSVVTGHSRHLSLNQKELGSDRAKVGIASYMHKIEGLKPGLEAFFGAQKRV